MSHIQSFAKGIPRPYRNRPTALTSRPEVSTLSRLARPPAEQTVSHHSGPSPFAYERITNGDASSFTGDAGSGVARGRRMLTIEACLLTSWASLEAALFSLLLNRLI
jgi:hypothetical protein